MSLMVQQFRVRTGLVCVAMDTSMRDMAVAMGTRVSGVKNAICRLCDVLLDQLIARAGRGDKSHGNGDLAPGGSYSYVLAPCHEHPAARAAFDGKVRRRVAVCGNACNDVLAGLTFFQFTLPAWALSMTQ